MPTEDYEVEHTPDVSDRATAEEMRGNAAALRENEARLIQVQKPLPDGSYEHTDCGECGNEIGAERLKLAPANHLCIFCASAAEKRQKHFFRN
jgi:RNA polymerase-binding transcription factor DksA